MRTRRGNGIRVHTQYLHIRQCLAQMLLELLRAGAELVEQAAAFGAGIIERSRIAAVMANEPPGDAVPREIHAAIQPQSWHSNAGAKPRRFKNRMLCSPREMFSRSSCSNTPLTSLPFPPRSSCRISTMRTEGS